MKTEPPKPTDAYWKIVDVIRSCTRETHFRNTINLITNFKNMFPSETVRLELLTTIYNNYSKPYRVKQLVW
jgi:hypothetical protein